jgi:hypothetical protein
MCRRKIFAICLIFLSNLILDSTPSPQEPIHFGLRINNQTPNEFDFPTTSMISGSKLTLFGRLEPNSQDIFMARSGEDGTTIGVLRIPIISTLKVVNIAWKVSDSESCIAINFGAPISSWEEINSLLQNSQNRVNDDDLYHDFFLFDRIHVRVKLDKYMKGRCKMEFYEGEEKIDENGSRLVWLDLPETNLQIESSGISVIQGFKSSTARSTWVIQPYQFNSSHGDCFSLRNSASDLYLTANNNQTYATLEPLKSTNILSQYWILERLNPNLNNYLLRSCQSFDNEARYLSWDQTSVNTTIKVNSPRGENKNLTLTPTPRSRPLSEYQERYITYITRPTGFVTNNMSYPSYTENKKGTKQAKLTSEWETDGDIEHWETFIPLFRFDQARVNGINLEGLNFIRFINQEYNYQKNRLETVYDGLMGSLKSNGRVVFPKIVSSGGSGQQNQNYRYAPIETAYYNDQLTMAWKIIVEPRRNNSIFYRFCQPSSSAGVIPKCMTQIERGLEVKDYDENSENQLFTLTPYFKHPYFNNPVIREIGRKIYKQRILDSGQALLKLFFGGSYTIPWYFQIVEFLLPVKIKYGISALNLLFPKWECSFLPCKETDANTIVGNSLKNYKLYVGLSEKTTATVLKTGLPKLLSALF